MMGEVEYEGKAFFASLPLLVAGDLLHLGTGTGFGLGKFAMGDSELR